MNTNSSASSHVVNYSQRSACQGDCSHLKATSTLVDVRQASETSYSKSSPGNFQHQYLAELLVNVNSYCLMAKSVSCCCVRGSQLFLNLVTYTPYLLEMCLPAYVTGVTVICVSPGIMFPAHISLGMRVSHQ